MKIGFLRLGLPIELDLDTASVNTLGTEIRKALLLSWLKKGFDVTVYTPFKEKDFVWVRKQEQFKNLNYEPLLLPKDEGVLFIEMGVSNTTYTYSIGKFEKSYVERCFECIAAFEGLVVYYQHGVIPFPVEKRETKSENPLNLANLHKRYDLFKNKQWLILHHFINEEGFKKEYSQYNNVNAKFKFIPLCYGDSDPWFEVKPNPPFDVLFIGSQWDSASKSAGQERFEEIAKFYDTSLYRGYVVGKWEQEVVKKFKYCKYLGQLGKHGDAYRLWNNSYACVWTTSSKVKKLGLIPTRPLMVMRSGAVCLADSTIFGVEKFIDKKFIVSTSEEVKRVLDELKSMSIEERDKLRREQLSKFPKWDDLNWNEILRW